jgi:outer membrane protein W
MKRLLLLLVLSVFSTSIFAQLNKGQWLVGGNAGFYYITQNYSQPSNFQEDKHTSVQIAPAAGYFIFDRLAVGLRTIVNFSHFSSRDSVFTSSQTNASNATTYSISPFIRYYFLPKANKVNLFVDVSYLYSFTKSKYWYNDVYNGSSKEHWYSYAIAAGPAFFINPKIAVELTAGYTFKNEKIAFEKVNTLMLSAGFQIYLGK